MHFARIVLAVAWTGDSIGERISEILFGLIMALTVMGTTSVVRTADETQSSEGDFAVIVLSATIKLPVVVAKRQRVWLRGNDPED
jgi:hypothetical protein